jgi:hypothetical protein
MLSVSMKKCFGLAAENKYFTSHRELLCELSIYTKHKYDWKTSKICYPRLNRIFLHVIDQTAQ